PRVSRSSALASKATGFPIAKIAARLAVGYTLDEILNDITGKTPACFEPTIDYVVTKIPRFAFEKFRGSPAVLTTAMKSVGEAMAIGRCFEESFQKALRSLETGHSGWGCDRPDADPERAELERQLRTPSPDRIFAVRTAMVAGYGDADIHRISAIDPWFLAKLRRILEVETRLLRGRSLDQLQAEALLELKQLGFSDRQIAWATGSHELQVRDHRQALGVNAVFKTVDTCAAEFASSTPYHYATYERPLERLRDDGTLELIPPESEVQPENRRKVMILGGGPNRIGQGIEFDYCCVHASFALQAEGLATVMVNSNPETVSTDYDISDRLYFEPLTLEDVLNVIEAEKPEGVIVQFGGQTPLKLAIPLLRWLATPAGQATGTRIWGTSPDSIDTAEDREQFEAILRRLEIRQPRNGLARSEAEARAVAARVGYPVVVRPSYVLGGRAMEVVYGEEELNRYMVEAVNVEPDHPVLIDQYLENATEVDVDALCDATGRVVIGGLMEHIEPAGVHSGDSACALPAVSLEQQAMATIRQWSEALALALQVNGLINLQFAIKDGDVYIIEANPRASRTVPFVAKATGAPLAKIASQIMAGRTLEQIGLTAEPQPPLQAVKEAVLPFKRFPGADSILGPEMRSTGEVMGTAAGFGLAYAKAELGAGEALPTGGTVFLSTHDRDKPALVPVARRLSELGFRLVATDGTARAMEVVFDESELNRYMAEAVNVEPDHPVLIDQYLENAVEVDVDALCDATGTVVIGGVMEHIEPAGIHSGDSACCLPAVSLGADALATIRQWSQDLALALEVRGLINLQFAVQRDPQGIERVFIIEANPRASRTVPFVAKATGVALAKLASRVMAGESLAELGLGAEPIPPLQTVKEAVLPFKRFPGSDTLLGPEMRSTGEVMGIARGFGMAFAKAELAANEALPTGGTVFLSTHDRDKQALVPVARRLADEGFSLTATTGTAAVLAAAGLAVEPVLKVHEGRPNIEDAIRSGSIQLIINTPIGRQAAHDDKYLRRAALDYAVPTVTTLAGARAAVEAIAALQQQHLEINALQDIHRGRAATGSQAVQTP
ncbi:MAG: carbamoyl-phosphate synthase large subunit, partial [Cyanobium sp.]